MSEFDRNRSLEAVLKKFTNNQQSILNRYFDRGGNLETLKLQFQLSPEMSDEAFWTFLKNFIRMYGLEKLEFKLDSTPAPRSLNPVNSGSIAKSQILPKMDFGDEATQVVRKAKSAAKNIEEKPVDFHEETTERIPVEKPEKIVKTNFVEIKDEPAEPKPIAIIPEPAKPAAKPAYKIQPIAEPGNTKALSEEELAKRALVLEYKAKGYLGPPTKDWDGKTERRKGEERRSGVDRRDAVETIFKNKRFGKERRAGKDRRQKY